MPENKQKTKKQQSLKEFKKNLVANKAKFTILYPIKNYQAFKETEKYDL